MKGSYFLSCLVRFKSGNRFQCVCVLYNIGIAVAPTYQTIPKSSAYCRFSLSHKLSVMHPSVFYSSSFLKLPDHQRLIMLIFGTLLMSNHYDQQFCSYVLALILFPFSESWIDNPDFSTYLNKLGMYDLVKLRKYTGSVTKKE